MKDKKAIYYLIHNSTVAKREESNGVYSGFIFRNGKWISDEQSIILDHLWGYDPSEPEGSPFRFGNESVLREMKEISEEEAALIMNQQTLDMLKEVWKTKFKKEKDEWDKNPRWPAKLVTTYFEMNGIEYSIGPEDIGLTTDCWDQGFMETIQGDISGDLREYGATKIFNNGFLD